jgi:hypothetical protein
MNTILLSCIGTDLNISNPNLLHHFLNHYKELGIREWSITLHVGIKKELQNLEVFETILNEHKVPYEVWIEEFDTHKRERRHNTFVEHQDEKTWIFGVDLDEFVDFPCEIPDYLDNLSNFGYNCLCGKLVDRVDTQGFLKYIEKDIPIEEQFRCVAEVKKNIYQPSTPKAPFEKKLAIINPLQWGVGHHFINRETRKHQKESPEILNINHYAWDHLLVGRIQQRVEYYKNHEGFDWGQEYINMIEYIAKYGQLRKEDIGLS